MDGFTTIFLLQVISLLMVLSLIFSAYGFAMHRRWAFWLSYVQFPIRAINLVLTVGWITLLSQLIGGKSYQVLMFIAIGLEVLRQLYIVSLHRRLIKSSFPKKQKQKSSGNLTSVTMMPSGESK